MQQLSLWKMISSKFRRNRRRRKSWNPGSIQSTNQLQILVSNHDHKIGERYPGQEEEILEVELFCHSCGAKGHLAKDCQRPKIICFGCNQEGHMKNQCPNRAAWGRKSTGGGPNRGGNLGGNGAGKRS
jgi:hypothetical protein